MKKACITNSWKLWHALMPWKETFVLKNGNIGEISGDTYVTKYVLGLSVVPVITEIRIYPDEKGHFSIPAEYRSDVTYGANVKSLAVALYSEGVMSNDRIAAFLNAAGSDELGLSEGSVYGFCKKFARNAGMSIHHLAQELLNQTVVATDATTVTINGEQNYMYYSIRRGKHGDSKGEMRDGT